MASNRRGKAKLPEYGTWADMLQRCKNPNLRSYPLYGGKGIKVCERWQSFDNFYADMGSKQKGYSLERIDSTGDYEPSNCRWATPFEQSINTSRNTVLEFKGKKMTVTEWAYQLGIKPVTLFGRLTTLHWSVERALTTPVSYGNRWLK